MWFDIVVTWFDMVLMLFDVALVSFDVVSGVCVRSGFDVVS